MLDAKVLLRYFPKGHIVTNYDLSSEIKFVVDDKSGLYVLLDWYQTKYQARRVLLEQLAFAAYDPRYYFFSWKNRALAEYVRNGLNAYCMTTFSQEDFKDIYIAIGDGCNPKLSNEFIQSGYCMSVLREKACI